MENSIFRKKNIDRINTPEDLNSYLRITNPPIWMALTAVLLLLIGAIVWGCTAKLETKAVGLAVCENGNSVCYVNEKDISSVKTGTTVYVGDTTCKVSEVHHDAIKASSVLSDYEMSLAGFEDDDRIYEMSLNSQIDIDSSEAEIVLESVSPYHFLFDSKD